MIIQKAVVGSESALKLRAVGSALETLNIQSREIIGCKAESGIPKQPRSKQIMKWGATNRAEHAQRLHPNAELYFGVENGLIQEIEDWYSPACIVVLVGSDDTPYVSFSSFFPIPEWIVREVLAHNTELGHIVQKLADGGEKDPMSWLSKGAISREKILSQAIQCALVPILYADRFNKPSCN